MLLINERPMAYRAGLCPGDLAASVKPGADIFIVNGYPAPPQTPLQDGDRCWLMKRGEIPDAREMEHLLYARHTPGVQDRVKRSTVGIMGLGGLGSVVAIALARIGVGTLLLVDFDVVEPSNLNRQQYFIDQVGLKKTAAMQANLVRVNPYLQVRTVDVLLTEENIPRIFQGVDVLVECFDGAPMKAAAMRAVLRGMPGVGYVGASGMAGYGDNNAVCTKKIHDRVYVVGDFVAAAEPGRGLMAPRVGIAAHHQANQVLRLLLGEG